MKLNTPDFVDGLKPVTNRMTATDFKVRFGLMPMWVWLVGAGLALICGIAGFLSLTHNTSAAKSVHVSPPVVTVTVENAQPRLMKSQLEVTGAISAWDPLSIGSEVSGLKIDNVLAEEGDHVKKGQVLATLNAAVLKGALNEAKAKLIAARANVSKSIQPNRPEEISGLKAALAQAEANLAEAKANHIYAENTARRYAELVKQGAVSFQDAESHTTTATTTAAQVRAAEFFLEQAKNRLHMAETGGRREDIDISKASQAELQATVEKLQAQVDQTIIKAPDDGLITRRDAHIGDIAAMNKALFAMVRGHRLELRALVADADIGKIIPGQAVLLTAGGEPVISVTGSVREISPEVDSQSRLATVKIDVPLDSGLRIGMFVHGQVDLGARNVITVPAKAILSRDGRTFVLVVQDNRQGKYVVSHDVKLGSRSGNYIEIVSGLKPGDPIAIAGAGFLKNGDSVRVTP